MKGLSCCLSLSYQLSLCDASLPSQENSCKVIYWISCNGLCHFALTMLQLGMMMMDAANLQVPVTVGGAEMTSFIQQVLLTPVVAIQQLFGSFAAWKVKQTHVCPDCNSPASRSEAPTPPPSRGREDSTNKTEITLLFEDREQCRHSLFASALVSQMWNKL